MATRVSAAAVETGRRHRAARRAGGRAVASRPGLAELREAVDGREDEFLGLGAHRRRRAARPRHLPRPGRAARRGVETVVGWFTASAATWCPSRSSASASPWCARVAAATASASCSAGAWRRLAVLGVLHVVRGPERSSGGFDTLGTRRRLAGRARRRAAAQPARRRRRHRRAGRCCSSAACCSSPAARCAPLAGNVGKGMAAVAVPRRPALRKAFGDISTLQERPRGHAASIDHPAGSYDFAQDDELGADDEPPAKPKRRRAAQAARRPSRCAGPGEQVELDLGPGAERGQWALPPLSYLTRSTSAGHQQGRGRGPRPHARRVARRRTAWRPSCSA